MSSAQSLSDITDERVVPAGYLGVLILLFLFMVLDRLFYTLGLHLGKVTHQPLRFLWFLPFPCSALLCPALVQALSSALRPALPSALSPCPALGPCFALGHCPASPALLWLCPALLCTALACPVLPCLGISSLLCF